ncbi:hypothetical protein L6452_35921 [Arctium lappa]|uniref:Uncharacterized protein n=1 Tax=Arctium lappa TaxID=4217 RepID=A0ACB8Y8B0_ARCLA|nr:hypothetical protein L6452_35921 [Arctium lappa]
MLLPFRCSASVTVDHRLPSIVTVDHPSSVYSFYLLTPKTGPGRELWLSCRGTLIRSISVFLISLICFRKLELVEVIVESVKDYRRWTGS